MMNLRRLNSGLSRRRHFVLIFAFCLIILCGNYLRNAPGSNIINITFKTFIEPIVTPVPLEHTTTSIATSKETVVHKLPILWKGYGGKKNINVHLDPNKEQEPEIPFETDKKATEPILEHQYQSNGLLAVNPKGQHPIYDLIEKSEAAWQAKLQKASRSLPEAVVEYKRRYGRAPPKGFDKWWEFVEKHKVQLPDEYDQIHRDLEAFWGVDPQELQAAESMPEIWGRTNRYTVGKVAIQDPIDILNVTRYDSIPLPNFVENGNNIISMLRKFDLEQYIPPFRAIFGVSDNPSIPIHWDLYSQAVEHAKKGTTATFPMSDSPFDFNHRWLSSCDPGSPVWATPIDFDAPFPDNLRPDADPMSPANKRTFIYDHRAAMDPCQHPHILKRHGEFVSHLTGPTTPAYLLPLISVSPSALHLDITAALPINWVEDVYNPDWKDRVDERLHWRGTNTGIYHQKSFLWRFSHRINMMRWTQLDWSSSLRILGLGAKRGERVGEGNVVHKGRWAPAALDISFIDKPTSCEDDGTCDELAHMFDWKKRVSYILDMDGNGWSSRFKRLITTSSCIFKATIYPEWFTDRLQPWVHYVPVQIDLSDLWDSFAFFRGDLNGKHGHDDLAKKIGAQGRDWSLNYWREEDLVAYNFRLLLEYVRLTSLDRDSMSFELD
ncbi:hypothetical protein BDP27DRAFT_1310663 [Rhodocollybia butyracea]|uniref:Glycosyl transferase CAP10 domain-containing protein n=1 Tax=Rhodocollybia butyracea TaxID=206335 RepID=A0A9P5QBK4_9AGAR|nr:hypothetical protein BDP27DRAFT_1310663 [Rhodocollybia butyracea]